ncbi:hypothetical protein [Sphingobium sp. HDIP04]|uniref:hypothetical protein n=1 Tax=Sphingobium sp. HDIP04 TaxID=428994 RepID=UPI0003877CA8|nr:hypothetical protein [Sphingobium sp. HDIP04]EQA97230.1 hypothetical protein L286_23165 [Sphingobium sp. HDIP04]
MTPIERAARALCKLDGYAEDGEREGKPLWRSYLPQVQAVLDAIEEPSPRMTEAGATVIQYVGPEESQSAYQSEAANVWRFIIHAMREDFSTKA